MVKWRNSGINTRIISTSSTGLPQNYHFKLYEGVSVLSNCGGAAANFPFVNGRCHFSERSLPFETVDAIYNGRYTLHFKEN